jgi:hypothetical protein
MRDKQGKKKPIFELDSLLFVVAVMSNSFFPRKPGSQQTNTFLFQK